MALDPNQPESLRVAVPASPRGVQDQVESDINGLFVVLGGISLLIGALGIANITLVSGLERVGEIGLRRAVGAARRIELLAGTYPAWKASDIEPIAALRQGL